MKNVSGNEILLDEIHILTTDDEYFSNTKLYLDPLIKTALDTFYMDSVTYKKLYKALLNDVEKAAQLFLKHSHNKGLKFSIYFGWYIQQQINSCKDIIGKKISPWSIKTKEEEINLILQDDTGKYVSILTYLEPILKQILKLSCASVKEKNEIKEYILKNFHSLIEQFMKKDLKHHNIRFSTYYTWYLIEQLKQKNLILVQ